MSEHDITLNVNGEAHELRVEARTLLVTALREELGYTGANVGCETGRCGACTVRVDGEAIKSCTRFAVQADGAEVETVEGLSENGDLSSLQASFKEN
ncbi:MAG: (2Fe-2S)-binding protein, partial [Halobacteriota archaeon]